MDAVFTDTAIIDLICGVLLLPVYQDGHYLVFCYNGNRKIYSMGRSCKLETCFGFRQIQPEFRQYL